MTHHEKRSLKNGYGRLAVTAVAIFIAAYLLLSNTSGHAAATAEARFADTTTSGLAVVPASGVSETSYTGAYTGTYTGTYTASYVSSTCSLSASPSSITTGNGTTLSWSSTNPAYVSSATINPGSYNVSASGSRTVNPTVTTTYTLTVTAPAGSSSCSTTVTVAPASCPNGLNIVAYPSCVCPVGKVQSGTTCIDTTPSTGSYTGAYTGAYTPATGSYTPATGSYTPAGSCWDGSTPGAGGVCPPCPSGYTQVGNTCVPPQGPQFVGFTATQGFNATGHLEVRPSLVRSGNTTRVYWSVTNVKDCTVTGSNGDHWSTLSSGASGQVTGAIVSRTDYTLFCHALTGATPSTITETRTVNVLPSWFEPSGN